jgi:hypothetical protein
MVINRPVRDEDLTVRSSGQGEARDALRARTSNEDCKAKTFPPIVRKNGRRDMQRRIGAEAGPLPRLARSGSTEPGRSHRSQISKDL